MRRREIRTEAFALAPISAVAAAAAAAAVFPDVSTSSYAAAAEVTVTEATAATITTRLPPVDRTAAASPQNCTRFAGSVWSPAAAASK